MTFLLDTIESTSGRFKAHYEAGSPVQLDGPTPVRPFPVVLTPETPSGLWMECAKDAEPGRVIWASDGENGHYLDGYYHPTLADFIRGTLTNLRDGRFTIVDDGISIPYSEPPHDPFRAPINFWAAGFQKQNGLPPRLPWPTSYYDRYAIDVTRPAGAKRTSSAPDL